MLLLVSTSRKKTASYHHGNLRTAAMAKAAALISAEGVDAVTLRSLARDLGVTHAALRHHFGDRRSLLQEIASEGFDALSAALADALAVPIRRDRVRAAGAAYLDTARRLPGHFRIMFGREVIAAGEPPCESLRVPSECAFGLLLQIFDAAKLDAETLLAWSVVHGLAMLSLQGALTDRFKSDDALEALLNETLDLVAEKL